MGMAFSCVAKDINADRLDIDMTALKNRNLPIVWVSGQQNTGKKTHANLIKEKFNYEHVSVSALLREEAAKESDRALALRDALDSKKQISEDIVIDLLKESLLNSTTNRGFVISNFPKTAKQAQMFVKEIGNVSFVLHLHSNVNCLMDRAQQKSQERLDQELLKNTIVFADSYLKLSLMKFVNKVENINTDGPTEEVFRYIERVFSERLNVTPIAPIAAETDYVQQANNIEEEI